jgi:peptidoglycan hydrolase-like protein with peptidoglycan-binding domain
MSAKRTAGVLTGVVAAGAVAVAVTVADLPGARSSSGTGGNAVPATARVAKETLVDREDHDGVLGHGDTRTVVARAGGTVTWLPAAGATIGRGKAVYRLDNKPVVLLYGSLPAYRTLASAVEGRDVRQFERNLWALGYRGFTVDRDFTAATAAAVRQWQDDLGLAETGRVEPGQIRYAAGAIRIDSLTAEPGAVVQPGSELARCTGTTLLATVELAMDAQRLAKKGAAVEVELPDGTVAPGRVADVTTIVQEGQGDQPDTTQLKVTVAFTGKAPRGLDDAAVTVAFTAARRPDVLTVPVSALLALTEGGYGVQVVDGTTTTIVAVETGLFADGKVEVEGAGLHAGLQVGVPA